MAAWHNLPSRFFPSKQIGFGTHSRQNLAECEEASQFILLGRNPDFPLRSSTGKGENSEMRLHTFKRNSRGKNILLALAVWLAGVGTAQAQSISVTLSPQVITGLTIGQATPLAATLVNDT